MNENKTPKKEIKINLEYRTEGEHGITDITYSGKCSASQFDMAILAMMSTLVQQRDAEMKKRGLSRQVAKFEGQDANDFREYNKK